jgi:hypothetical protein
MKFLYFLLFFSIIFALLDPDPKFGVAGSGPAFKNANPDLGGQKRSKKIEKKEQKFHVLKCWMLRA